MKINKQKEFQDERNYNNPKLSLVTEEFKALKKGQEAYCFNEEQFSMIAHLCNKENINFSYKKDKDDFYTIVPERQ